MSEKVDKYLFEDNVKRLCLYDMLRRKDYLQKLTLEDLENLVNSVNTLTSNLQSDFEDGSIKIDVSDKDKWSSSSLFRDIFIHNILDIKIRYNGTVKDFKQMLKDRWKNNKGEKK